MSIIPRLLTAVTLAITTSSALATTYIVPTDRDLVKRAEAIVVGTAVTSNSQLTPDGRVVTIARLTVDEVLKGELDKQTSVDLVEPGGVVGDRVTLITGSPRYEAGKQYLVFLRRTADGWATYGFGLGKFEYLNQSFGPSILVRGGVAETIFGWDEVSGEPHTERTRLAIDFETFVKTIANTPGAPARADYFVHAEAVPRSAALVPRSDVSVPGGLDGTGAVSAGTANWTGAGAGVHYGLGSSNTNAGGGLNVPDHINAVLFNDPTNLIPPGVAAAGGVSATSGGFTTEVDVVVGKNFSTTQGLFNALMTHELGHTLGLRHSNENTSGGSCGLPLNCTSNAIMNSTVNVQSLQQWDLDAIRTVYAGQTGTGTASDYLSNSRWQSAPSVNFDYCFAPIITAQPASSSITAGAQATLTVSTSGGTVSPTYQWYIGNPPDTRTPVPNGTTSSLTVSPAATTTYFVRLTVCGPQDSNAATVTVTACTPPSAPAPIAAPSSITTGQSSTITETPTGSGPFTYQWYSGNSGVTTSPIGGSTSNNSITVTPTATNSYWVRVTGQCTPTADSPAVTVTVAPCVPPSASTPIASPSSIPTGQTSTVSVSVTGTSPFTYQWYSGNSGVTTSPIGGPSSNSFISVSPTTTTSYWVRVTGQCGSPSDSRETTVTVTCAPIGSGPFASPQTINNGQSSILSINPAGNDPFTIQWYQGSSGDTSNLIPGATGTSTVVSPTVNTSYWVRVSSSCGTQDSNSIVVVVNGSPCTPASITTQPPSATIQSGTPVTLTVVAAGTAPLTYQWYTGDKGDTSNAITGATSASLIRSPTVTTKYWVRVTGCNNSTADSNTATITISTCTAPSITTQPANVSAPIGTAATFKVVATGTALHYQWYEGNKGNTTKTVGTDASTFVTGAVDFNNVYWVRITGQCGTADSDAATVTAIAPPRGRAVKH